MWSTCLSSCGADEVPGALVERTPAGGATPSGGGGQPSLSFADGPISVGYDQHNHAAITAWLYGHNILRLALRLRPPVGLDALKVHLVADDLDAAYRPETWVDRVSWLVVFEGAVHDAGGAGARKRRDPRAQRAPVRDQRRRRRHRHRIRGARRARSLRQRSGANRRHRVRGVPPLRRRHRRGFSDTVRVGRDQFHGLRLRVRGERRHEVVDAGSLRRCISGVCFRRRRMLRTSRRFASSSTPVPATPDISWSRPRTETWPSGTCARRSQHAVTGFTATNMMDAFSFGFQANAIDRDTRFFKGDVAEFRWYADLLSDADVETVQRRTLARTCLIFFQGVTQICGG